MYTNFTRHIQNQHGKCANSCVIQINPPHVFIMFIIVTQTSTSIMFTLYQTTTAQYIMFIYNALRFSKWPTKKSRKIFWPLKCWLIVAKWYHEILYIWINSGWGNGLLPDGTKPIPESILTDLHYDQKEHILIHLLWKQCIWELLFDENYYFDMTSNFFPTNQLYVLIFYIYHDTFPFPDISEH